MEERRRECHPLLRGGRRESKFTHGLSPAQLQSLSAICEAILPPLSMDTIKNQEKDISLDQSSVQSFYQASGSQSPIPDETAEILAKRGTKEGVMLVRLVLKLLSFRIGTLLLCGCLCLDWKWPFIHNFSEIPAERREEILRKWSNSKFMPLRAAFVMIRLFCCFTFVSRVQ